MKSRKKIAGCMGILLACAVTGAAWAGAPDLITYQGRLQESGALVNGNRNVEIRLCTAMTGGTCYSTGVQGVPVLAGIFRTTFTTLALPVGGLDSGPWFIEVGVTGSYLTPREQLTSAAYAAVASSVSAAGVIFPAGNSTTALGYQAGTANTAIENIFLGYRAGFSNTSGSMNSFLGYQAGYSNSSGGSNVFLGDTAGYSNTTGGANSFLGYNCGADNTTGQNNTFIGFSCGQRNTTGIYNAYFGAQNGFNNTTGHFNTAVGMWAFYGNGAAGNKGNSGMFAGFRAGFTNTGSSNTFVGAYAGEANTAGQYNVYLGNRAGGGMTGSNNTAVGYMAGFTNTTGAGNIFLGYQAGSSETGSDKLYIDNSGTASPLIWGDFGANVVNINGRLGIGTTAPSTKLHIVGTGVNEGILMESSVGSGNPSIVVRANTPAGYATFLADRADTGSSAQLNLMTGGVYDWSIGSAVGVTNRLDIVDVSSPLTLMSFIKSSGNVGVGTISPVQKLHVAGNLAMAGRVIYVGGGTPILGAGCGGLGAAILGTDSLGQVAIGAGPGATCTVSFSASWAPYTPVCFVNNSTSAAAVRVAGTSSTDFTISGTLSGGMTIDFVCLGR